MKKFFLIIICALSSIYLFAEKYPFEEQDYKFRYLDNDRFCGDISFHDNEIRIEIPNEYCNEDNPFEEIITGSYEIIEDNIFTYLIVNKRKFLVLYDSDIILFLIECNVNKKALLGFNKKSVYYLGPEKNPKCRWGVCGLFSRLYKTDLQFSSCLREKINDKEIIYNGNTYPFTIDKPWVEGKDDDGIGEWISLKPYRDNISKILLINGYVDSQHPDYFYKNNRIKDIEIISGNNKYSYTLEDTFNPQIITLPFVVEDKTTIVIKSVYSGTKYKDTCLSGFFYLRDISE